MAEKDSIATPAALIFIDSLGTNLQFKSQFSFKDLSDFCVREGIAGLLNKNSLSDDELLKVAEKVSSLTKGNIRIDVTPEIAASRSPLSIVDLNIANKTAEGKHCKRCGAASGHRLLCATCYNSIAITKTSVKETKPSASDINLYAHVTLSDGNEVHVVDIVGDTYIGVDSQFNSHEFTSREAKSFHNMEDVVE